MWMNNYAKSTGEVVTPLNAYTQRTRSRLKRKKAISYEARDSKVASAQVNSRDPNNKMLLTCCKCGKIDHYARVHEQKKGNELMHATVKEEE